MVCVVGPPRKILTSIRTFKANNHSNEVSIETQGLNTGTLCSMNVTFLARLENPEQSADSAVIPIPENIYLDALSPTYECVSHAHC